MARYSLYICFMFCFSIAGAQDIEDSLAIQMAAQSTIFTPNLGTDYRPAESIMPAQTTGDAASPMKCFPSTTKGYDGDPALNGPNQSNVTGPKTLAFGGDIQVRSNNLSTREYNQVMTSDSKGNLYVAWEDAYFAPYTYIQIYKSADGGKTWTSYGYVKDTNVNLKDPSIAIGEGNANTFLLTYIRDDGVNIPVPEVATKDLNKTDWTFASVPVWTGWKGYAKPVINTDSNKFNSWFAYLTCEGIVNSAGTNVNVCTWRSTSKAGSWKDAFILFGNNDSYSWLDPDQSYGTAHYDLFLVCFNDDDNTLYFAHSVNSGAFWEPFKALHTLPAKPNYPVDPEIAAAVNGESIMIACTTSYQSNDNIGYCYSKDLGATWTTFYTMPGYTTENECAVSLNANEAGNSWHLTWNASNYICYTNRSQDLIWGWAPFKTVNDLKFASLVHPKNTVASVWNTDAPCVCWADFRDGGWDSDTYADFPENKGLATDKFQIDCSKGGTATMTLNAGVNNMNRNSLIFGSVTGVSPGSPFPGGTVLPLNWDVFTNMVINLTNTPTFHNFYGKHDSEGKRDAKLNISPFTAPSSVMIYFAYVMMDPWNYASNPIGIMIMP